MTRLVAGLRTAGYGGGLVRFMPVVIGILAALAAPARAQLQGTVTDRTTSAPIAGAGIYVTTPTGLCSYGVYAYPTCPITTTTDANGNYSLSVSQLNNNPTGTLIIQAASYWVNRLPFNTASGPTLNITLLPGGAVLQGTAADSSTQAGIAGATATLYSNSNYNWFGSLSSFGVGAQVQTNANGTYSFDSSNFFEAATSGIAPVALNVSAGGYFSYQSPSFFPINPPYPLTDNVTLIGASGSVLQGTLTDRTTGAPIAGAGIYVTTPSGLCSYGVYAYPTCPITTTTDANGNYAMAVSQLNYNQSGTIIVQAVGYWVNKLQYNITSDPTTLNITLLPGGAVLQGTATDSNTQAGIAGATATLYSNSNYNWFGSLSSFGVGTQVQSNANGSYSFDSSNFFEAAASGIAPVTLNVSAGGYFSYQSSSSFPINPPYPLTDNVTLIGASGTVLEGRLTDRTTGAPIAGAGIYVTTPTGLCSYGVYAYPTCPITTTTDVNGNYALAASQINNNTSGTLIFQAVGYWVYKSPFNITTSPTTLNITLLAGGTVVEGTVTDANTQAAIAGGTVTLYANGNEDWFGSLSSFGVGAQVQTGANGSYSFDSSNFFETSGSNLGAEQLSAAACVYYNYQSSSFQLSPPFPHTQNIQMSPSGQTSSITIATTPPGLNISVDGTSLVSPQTFNWVPCNEHTIATTSPQTVSAGTQDVFANWSNGGSISQMIAVPVSSTTYTAAFNTQYQLTTAANPAQGGAITPGGWFNPGSTVTITATPAQGYYFTGFSGALSGTGNPQTITMNGPASVTANFAPVVATSTALMSSANPSGWGQLVTFTASVTAGASAASGGSVTFSDGAVMLGTAPLNGAGQASLSTTSLAIGPHSITAAYSGTTSLLASTSPAVNQTVNQATTMTALSSAPNPSNAGQVVTFTASVSGQFGAAVTGTVMFMQGSTTLGSAALSGGMATLGYAKLAPGSHSIIAVYGGDANSMGSSSPAITQTVSKVTTSTSLTASPNPSTPGETVTFTATVKSSVSVKAAGMVTFKDGTNTLGTAMLSNAQAAFSTSTLTVGPHSITAVYNGTPIFAPSQSPAITQTVNKNSSTMAVMGSPNPSLFGQSVTFTATVSSSAGAPPNGEIVTFFNGSTKLGTAGLNGGSAQFSTSSLQGGSQTVTASYGGDADYNGSQASFTQVVNPAPTTTVLTSTPNPSNAGQTVKFSATVTSSTGAVPLGQVNFYDGSTLLGTGTLSGGVATFSTSGLTVGTHSVTAGYGQSADFVSSKSSPVTQVVK